jgi:hypothetical protein
MKPLGRFKRHFWLAKRMAKATGTDLATARKAGQLRQQEWAAMVTRCRSCCEPERCTRWLATAEQSGGRVEAPSFCLNGDRFSEVRRALNPEDAASDRGQ